MREFILYPLFVICICTALNCEKSKVATAPDADLLSSEEPLFRRVPASESGINFVNEIIENRSYNHILIDEVFSGGGVTIFDLNNDGLQDIYFAGNMVEDRLYLNQGNMRFTDITKSAGLKGGSWSTASAVADVNGDGFLDLYVGKFILAEPENRRNHLYINNGNGSFTESAAEYGLDHDGHCTAVNFFDYDKDGDMDLYVGVQPYVNLIVKAQKKTEEDHGQYTDRLYRNEGNGTFTDVTRQAGIINFNFTLSATVGDLNNDGWLDIYVASDYEEPDYYYQNNGDGTFTNNIHRSMRHISNFSMGVDLADINNDGWLDIYVADMAPANNYRSKANMSGMNPEKFWQLASGGYHYQYMYNTLQLNNGNGTFSEIGHMAGVSQTDWSWAALFADFDMDGYKDLFVANGKTKDTRNKDYEIKRKATMDSLANVARAAGKKPAINPIDLVHLVPAPVQKISNYMFVNTGDLQFEDKSKEWGIDDLGWTQGSAYADLDNDGDLDLVTSNINDEAFLYENRATALTRNNYLTVELPGDHGQNWLSYGARVIVYYGDQQQLQEVTPTRGYMSSCQPLVHFGLGDIKTIDRLTVEWPDGRHLELQNVATNQKLTLKQAEASSGVLAREESSERLFKDQTLASGIQYVHTENRYDDFATEVLLPHRMSRLGPCVAVADVNGDGMEDIFFGNAAGSSGQLYLQKSNNQFEKNNSQPWAADKISEDISALFFDANGDGAQDLYIVSGGNEFSEEDPALQDRLYLNDGKGNFSKAKLPQMFISGGVVKAADLDQDGDEDLFVGGRQVPGKYGYPARSFVLRNDKGRFTDVTEELAPELVQPGMISDVRWMDIDQDQDQDLIVAGEWMSIDIYLNEGGQLKKSTLDHGLQNTSGWWNRLAAADMDGDGDQDLIAGNLGWNIKFKASDERPFTVKIKDFDENGSNDIYLAYYDQNGNLYPVRGRQCSSQQMPFIKKKFQTYDAFAKASFDEVLGELAENALVHEATNFTSLYLENIGGGQFKQHDLPAIAQAAPIYGILPYDWNRDGNMDLLLAGNYYEREVETTRSDAGIGTLLLGDGNGQFKPVLPSETGIMANFDVRALAMLENQEGNPLIFILNNNLGLQVYEAPQAIQ